MPTLRQIEVFRAIFLNGGLSRAAAELRISQPTASRIVRRLEDELGTALFERRRGRLIPTASCERFAAEIDSAYQQMQDALQRASLSSRSEGRPYNVACSPSLGRRVVPEALAILAEGRTMPLSLRIVTVSQVLPTLLERQCDTAVTLFSILHQDIETVHVHNALPVLLTPRAYGLAIPSDDWTSALAERPWITFEPRSVHGDALAVILSEVRLVPRRTHLVRFAETAVGMVEAGVGCAIVDEFSAETADPARVATLRLTATNARFAVHVHRPISGDHAEMCGAFQTALAESFASRERAAMS
jgi:DNA-binding transcriptional LysR family regulator